MARGVRKIRMTEGLYFTERSSGLDTQVTIKPDQAVSFEVDEWIEGTSEKDKQSELTWMRQTNDRRVILIQLKSSTGYTLTLPKKLCGSYAYYVEASLSGSRDFNNPSGIYVNGHCDYSIVSSDWRKTPDGNDIKNDEPIKYGEAVYIWLSTEGLNGNSITIEVYNQALGSDTYVDRYTNVAIVNGEVAYRIANTTKWLAKTGYFTEGVEEFYIKAKIGNTYIKDHLGQENHAVYLNVKNEVVESTTEISENITPTKVFKAEVNARRYEPCKFSKITVTTPVINDGNTSTKTISLFEDGQSLQNTRVIDRYINRVVYFNFNDYSISPDAQKILNNILGFLLEHRGTTMQISGYACVIGAQDYNKDLSQKRGDSVKSFFIEGGLDSSRITSIGRGEYNIQSPDDYQYRNEQEYQDARRVDISFVFNGHDADTIIHHITSGSEAHGDTLTFNIDDYETDDCYLENDKHTKQIKVTSPDKSETIENSNQFDLSVHSKLPSQTSMFGLDYYAPLKYIWPSSAPFNEYILYINSCRYYTNNDKATINIKVYPDIKWTFAFEIELNISNKTFTNMPSGNLWAKHWSDAQPAGVQRSLINRRNRDGELTPKAGVPIKWGFGLEAEWNKSNSKRKFSFEVERKIKRFTDVVENVASILNQATQWAKNASDYGGFPVTFDIKYPKIVIGISWFAEGNRENHKLATVGQIGVAADPLIGAVGTIDLIAATATAAGSPAAAKLIQQFRGTIDKLGASFKFDIIFEGELFIIFEALTINSIDGITAPNGFILGGRFKMSIVLESSIEVGQIESQKALFILEVKAAVVVGCGGELKVGSDDKGVYLQPSVEFSGAKIVAKIRGQVGWWSWLGVSYELEETVIDKQTFAMEKKYFTDNE